jgi:Ca-activated chloride channel family protein
VALPESRPLRGLLAALILPLLGSCSGVPGKLRVLAGNLLAGRDRRAEAIVNYMRALDDDEAAPYAEYGLALVYQAMNEDDSALGRFAAAEEALGDGGHAGLRYSIHYNRGILRFEQGNFSAAAAEFRKALEYEPGHRAAKRNLELSLLSLERQGREDPAPAPPRTGGGEALFDYLRRRETERWRSQEWTGGEPFSGPDY